MLSIGDWQYSFKKDQSFRDTLNADENVCPGSTRCQEIPLHSTLNIEGDLVKFNFPAQFFCSLSKIKARNDIYSLDIATSHAQPNIKKHTLYVIYMSPWT